MSNHIRYDSVLVRYLARELDDRLAGRRLEALRLDREQRRAALDFGDESLVFGLHPTAGSVRLGPPPAAPTVRDLAGQTSVREVIAPTDERLLFIDTDVGRPAAKRVRRIVVELMTNQWNLLALNRDERIVVALWPRDAGGRELRAGATYQSPAPFGRAGAEEELSRERWHAMLADTPPAERAGRLVRTVAYTSPINAGALLGDAAETPDHAALEAARERYLELVSFPPPAPRLLELEDARQPYPIALPGVDSRRFPTLLDAFAAAAGAAAPEAPTPTIDPELLDRLRGHAERAGERVGHLEGELEDARPEAERLRRQANVLLSRVSELDKGMERVELADFDGGTIEIELDPALSLTKNADRLYARAKKRERAAERLPGLIGDAERERDRLRALLERAEAGEAGEEEVVAAVGRPPAEEPDQPEERPPYRRYRTSGGLEVRVGRNRRANDDLTFHHSHTEDIFLHARNVGGAHVILRWGKKEANPPQRDLLEAAVLAAVNSQARTAGTAAVDWTRRKYVRSPRKSPPGLVTLERDVSTLFVEPDAAVAERMRE